MQGQEEIEARARDAKLADLLRQIKAATSRLEMIRAVLDKAYNAELASEAERLTAQIEANEAAANVR